MADGPQIIVFQPLYIGPARLLWARTEGLGLSAADDPPQLLRYLARNPGTSFVAVAGSSLVGTVLCGHDGRRGLLHHPAVAPAMRRQGLGRSLVRAALAGLRAEDIDKCHLMVFGDHRDGPSFWLEAGAVRRTDLQLLSLPVNPAR